MERLTKVDSAGQNDLIRCFDCGPEKAGENLEHCGYCERWRRALDKLAAYEDSGLEPEEIVAMRHTLNEYHKEADPLLREKVDGRLVVLSEPMIPLIQGDDPLDTDVYCPSCGKSVSGGWPDAEPDSEWKLCQCPYCGQSIDDSKVITRAEAEAALEGGKNR